MAVSNLGSFAHVFDTGGPKPPLFCAQGRAPLLRAPRTAPTRATTTSSHDTAHGAFDEAQFKTSYTEDQAPTKVEPPQIPGHVRSPSSYMTPVCETTTSSQATPHSLYGVHQPTKSYPASCASPKTKPAPQLESTHLSSFLRDQQFQPPSPPTATRPSPNTWYALRALRVSPQAGIPKATCLRFMRKAGNPPPELRPPIFPTPSALDLLGTPASQLPVYCELDGPEKTLLERELRLFASGLHDDAQRVLFRSGHRLSRKQRDSLLARLTPFQRSSKGLRFSDDYSPFRDDDFHTQVRCNPSIRHGHHPTPDHRVILADLWYYADPLLLEHTADAWSNGVNIGYSGEFTTETAPNMAKTKSELAEVLSTLKEEISAGRARGFFPLPPFLAYKVIPAGLTPKKDGTMRPIDNFSVHGDTSINALSDRVELSYPGFAAGIANLQHAGTNGKLLSWDVEKAFANNHIRPCDQWLAVTRLPFSVFDDDLQQRHALIARYRQLTDDPNGVPQYVYCYRTHCPFGLATSGYRWEVTGGKTINSHYIANQPRISVDLLTHRVSLSAHTHFPPDADGSDPLITDTTHELAPLKQQNDAFIHPIGYRRLGVLATERTATQRRIDDGVDLTGIARNVDDFIKGFGEGKNDLARRTELAIIFLHARIGIRLKPSKFTGLVQATEYNGFTLIVPDTISFPHDKCAKLIRKLKRIQHSVVEFPALDSAIGCCIYLTMMFPQLRGTMTPLYAALFSVGAKNLRTDNIYAKRFRRTTKHLKVNMSTEALETVRFMLRVVREGPASSSAAIHSVSDPSRAREILHTDWAQQRASDKTQGWGAVLLSHGLWFSMAVPLNYVDAWGNSSPAMEAFAVLAALRGFRAKLQNTVILVFTDNIPFIQAFEKYHNDKASTSKGLTTALRAISYELVTLSSIMFLEWVDTKTNLADPVSRDNLQAFKALIGSPRLSEEFSQVDPPSMKLPSF